MKFALVTFVFLFFGLQVVNTSAQSPFPNGVGLNLPVSEDYLKTEFSFRYNLHAQQDGTPYERKFYTFRTIEPGFYFEDISLDGELIPELQGLKLIHLTLIPGRELRNSQGNSTLITSSHAVPPPRTPQHFLIGLDAKNKFHYLSGNIFLDPLSECLVNPADLAEVAKIRLYYLFPDELKPVKAPEGHVRFETKSNLLNRRIVIDLIDDLHFSIFPKGDPDNRLAVVGGWISGPQQDPRRMQGDLPSD
ncbi:MAG: hypothetical protein RLZZ519_641 [Bacteroidota bacterium]